MKRPLRVGLFGTGLDAYWPQFKGLKPRLQDYVRVVQKKMERPRVEVVNRGLIDKPVKALAAGPKFRATSQTRLTSSASCWAWKWRGYVESQVNIQPSTFNAEHRTYRLHRFIRRGALNVQCSIFFCTFAWLATVAQAERAVIPAIPEGRRVDTNTLRQIYDGVKTPFKYGVVLKGADTNEFVDCPSIFRSGNHWFMMYVAITNQVGYQTFLARSDDLLHWEKLGKILSFTQTNEWDVWQADGGIALADYHWDGSHELEKFDGKFWLAYIGGAKQGYETDPLSIGIAWTKSPAKIKEWNRVPENPVLSPKQTDVREFERKTLYKSQVIHDEAESLGFPFVMFYNGKYKNGFERIGMAVSRDLVHWNRYGENPVVANGEAKTNGMSGDPQIVKIGDVWTMFYFGAGWQPKAFDTFACSYDLVHWTKWNGANLIEPSEPFDKTYAHKPWVLKWHGVVYHFYCAVGSEGRVIALATSRDLKIKAGR